MIKVGDRVRINDKCPSFRYARGNVPTGCEGTILKIYGEGIYSTIKVSWDGTMFNGDDRKWTGIYPGEVVLLDGLENTSKFNEVRI